LTPVITESTRVLRPQPGKQTDFLASTVDFCIYGGGAGGGKTFGICLEGLRYHNIKEARVLVFRRQSVDIDKPGALWDEMSSLYLPCGAKSNRNSHTFTFPSGMQLTCAHLNTEADKYTYQGTQQLAAILFDEITHFTETQFWYMFSRARNTYGIRPYIRATCNPEPGWVADFISWYIGENGLVRPDRDGVIRYFIREGETVAWGNSPDDLMEKSGCEREDIKSFQFISATLEDNKILMQNGGREYISSLKLTGPVEAKRLLEGNWKIKREGKIFKQSDFQIFTRLPLDIDYKVIIADTAQKTKEANDYTVIQCWGRVGNKIYLIDQVRGKFEYSDLKLTFLSFHVKHMNGLNAVFIEDKVSGTSLIQDLKREIQTPVFAVQRNKDKYTRAYDVQGYVQAGHVYLNPMLSYYTEFISEVISFTADDSHDHDDQCDGLFDAVDKLLINPAKPMYGNKANDYVSLSSKIY
jgi:predicted phage terminase large subunit-like protein